MGIIDLVAPVVKGGLSVGTKAAKHTFRPGYFNRVSSAAKAFGKVPGKGFAGLALAGVGAFAAGSLTTPPSYESEGTAAPDGMNGYSTQENYRNYQYGLSERIASMNVSGDLVFGLHNKRHG